MASSEQATSAPEPSTSATPASAPAAPPFPDAELLPLLRSLRSAHPTLGASKLLASIKASHLQYALSEKRLIKVLKEQGLTAVTSAPTGRGRRYGPGEGSEWFFRTSDVVPANPDLNLAPLSDWTVKRLKAQKDAEVKGTRLDYMLYDAKGAGYGVASPPGDSIDRDFFVGYRELAETKRSPRAVFMLFSFLFEHASSVGISDNQLRLQLAREYGTHLTDEAPPPDSDFLALNERLKGKWDREQARLRAAERRKAGRR